MPVQPKGLNALKGERQDPRIALLERPPHLPNSWPSKYQPSIKSGRDGAICSGAIASFEASKDAVQEGDGHAEKEVKKSHGCSSPLFQFSDLSALIKVNKANQEVMGFLGSFDINTNPVEYQIPLYYIVGEDDWQTPAALTQDYVQRIKAPEKKVFIIPNAGHRPMIDQPALFLSLLRDIKNRQENEKGIEQE